MKCQVCRDKAVISSYNGTFCAEHFKKSFESIALDTIKKYKLIEPKETIAVANSGGKDSLSLLYILSKYYSKSNNIMSITIDEGINGYRDKTIEIMKEYTEKFGVEYKIFTYKDFVGKGMDDIVKVRDGIPCAVCGVFRRYLINAAAIEMKADKVATAHNLDDEAESMMMNLLQNDLDKIARSGPRSGVMDQDGFVPRIKPFVFLSEKETMLFSLLNGINAIHTPCPYAGFGFRGVISKKIKELESLSPGSKKSLVLKAMEIREKAGVNGSKPLIKCRICGAPSSNEVCDACRLKEELLAV